LLDVDLSLKNRICINEQNKHMLGYKGDIQMSQITLPKSYKICATCALWGGIRTAEPGGYTKFEQDQKGKCQGGLYNTIQMPPMATCNKWEIWPPIRK